MPRVLAIIEASVYLSAYPSVRRTLQLYQNSAKLDYETFVKDSSLGIRKAFLKIWTGSSQQKKLNKRGEGGKIPDF